MGNNSKYKKKQNKSKKNNISNQSYQKNKQIQLIEIQSSNGKFIEKNEDFKEESKQESNKMILGLENLGNTCYLNSALQTIRQINYYSSFLPDTDFSMTLKQLFQSTIDDIRIEKLSLVFDIIQDYQKHHENGGDAYMSLINLLSKISSEITNKQDIEIYQKNIQAVFEDGMFCNQCNKYENSEQIQQQHLYEYVVGIEDFSLSSVIFNPQSLYQDSKQKQNCSSCGKPTLKPQRMLIYAPKFLIFKLLKLETKNQPKCKKINGKQTNKIQFEQKIENKIFSYNLIGFSELHSSHYTYKAKYDDLWYYFSDESGSIIEKNDLNIDNINYLIYINDK